jgi:hypothetical protein
MEFDGHAIFKIWVRQSSAIYMLALEIWESIKLRREFDANLKLYPGEIRFFEFCLYNPKGAALGRFVPR